MAIFRPRLAEARDRLEAEGKTVMLVQRGGQWLGLLALADQVRPEARAIVEQLRSIGVNHVAMLTGDNRWSRRTSPRNLAWTRFMRDSCPKIK
jgi:Cd2+/Zn2+-exporting ATPase